MDDQPAAAQDRYKPDTATPPVNITEPSNAETTQPATQQQLSDFEKQMTGFERATLRWAKIAVLLSALAAAFVCAQWYEMHKGGEDTHALAQAADTQAKKMTDMSTAADKIREAAQNMVVQDQRIADNAKSSIQATQDSFRADQRAWVAPVSGTITLDLAHSLRVDEIAQNMGKTPAFDVSTILDWKDIPEGPVSIKYSPLVKVVGRGTLYPNSKIVVFASSNEKPTEQQLDAFRTGKRLFYFFGSIGYKDVFAREHHSHFCFVVNRDLATVAPCDKYNDAN